MDLSKATTLGIIETTVNGKSKLTDYLLKKSGHFFYLVDIITLMEIDGRFGEGIQLAFHESEVIEQLKGYPDTGIETIEEFPGDTFLSFLCSMLGFLNEMEDSEMPRNMQLSEVMSYLLMRTDGKSEIQLSLKSWLPQILVQANTCPSKYLNLA
jgi:hypothetical protein